MYEEETGKKLNNKDIESKKKKKVSEFYKDIFKIYLEFCPEFKRSLVVLPEMYEWLKELGLNRGLSKPDFFILMEWFNSLNLIKPFCVLHFPPKHDHHICWNDSDKLTNDYDDFKLNQYYEEGLIAFPKSIYDVSPAENIKVEKWIHKEIEHRIMTKRRNAKEDNLEEEKTSIEETRYLYHPIQFFQVLTYLQGTTHKNLKNFKEFYWNRRFDFNDWIVDEINKNLKKEGKSKTDFIQEESSKGSPFYNLKWIYYIQNKWLDWKSLKLWIKIESYLAPLFYYKRSNPDINMRYQISKYDWYDNDKYKEYRKRYYKWRNDVEKNFSNYFTLDEYQDLKEFREIVWRYKDLDGLEDFIDLFLHISNDKKEKLKGYPNYWINMVQIYAMLKIMENKFIKHYPELSEFKTERKWYEPKYVFENKKELSEHKKKIFLDFGLIQEETYVIFVEGPTESIILEDWTDLVFYRTNIKVNIRELGGKRKKFIFEYLSKEFEVIEFFMVLDRDTEKYIEGLKNNYKGKGIPEDSFHIFYPDFVTANFTAQEIYASFLTFFDELKENIKKRSGQEFELSENDKEELRVRLTEKQDFEKFEKIIEERIKSIIGNPNYVLKKTKFAEHLREVMRKELSKSEGRRQYPFEEILGKFVEKIQSKKFPIEK